MSDRPARIGFIGCGSIAQKAHLPAYKNIPEVELVAFCDKSPETLEKAGAAFGVKNLYSDYHELLARDDIDAVEVCTPPNWRVEPVVAACEAGKHVLVQKPMATSIAEATTMIDAAKRCQVKLATIYMRRFRSQYHLVKRLMDAGFVGQVTSIRERTGYDGSRYFPDGVWRRSFNAMGGSLSLLGVHSADMFRWYMGPVKRLAGIGKTLVSTIEGDDDFSMVLEFADGALGVLESCYHLIPSDNRVEVYGDRGSIILSTGGHTCRCYATDADKFPWEEHLNGIRPTQVDRGWWEFSTDQAEEAALSPFRNYWRHWADCIQNDRAPATPGEEGRASLEIILAGYESSARTEFIELKHQTWSQPVGVH